MERRQTNAPRRVTQGPVREHLVSGSLQSPQTVAAVHQHEVDAAPGGGPCGGYEQDIVRRHTDAWRGRPRLYPDGFQGLGPSQPTVHHDSSVRQRG
jgi:hypothetical protein